MRKLVLAIISFIAINYCGYAQHVRFNPVASTFFIGSEYEFVSTGDINGDGLTDIVGATTHFSTSANDFKLFVWLQGTGGITQPQKFAYPHDSGTASCLTIADLYNDGSPEVIIGIGRQLYIYGWVNNALVAQDSFKTIQTYFEDGVTTGDFDSDGLMDIGICHSWGNRITVIYQVGEASEKWNMRHYNVPTTGYGHVISGKFGPLQQTALVYVNGQGNGIGYSAPVIVMTFDQQRQMKDRYDLNFMPGVGNSLSAAIVKRQDSSKELWVTAGGNRPSSVTSVWRGTQPLPDTTFAVYDIPDAMMAGNLDCDADEEVAIIHSGWARVAIYADTAYAYTTLTQSHLKQDGMALGDVNNDGLSDICFANGSSLSILYNNTPPCGSTAVVKTEQPVKGISLYPNPVTDAVHVKLQDAIGPGSTLQLISVDGRILETQSVHSTENVFQMRQQPSGVYFMRYTGSSFSQTIKLTK